MLEGTQDMHIWLRLFRHIPALPLNKQLRGVTEISAAVAYVRCSCDVFNDDRQPSMVLDIVET